jgi:hypothetical protein
MPANPRKLQDTPDQDPASTILQTVGEASADAREHLTGAAVAAGGAIEHTNQALRMRSDRTLGLVGAFSVGTAIGLLLGGSSRLLIVLALAPVALVAGTLMERMDRADLVPPRTLH